MSGAEPNITVNVDLTNPGQFFACCGLLELADHLWPGAEGAFSSDGRTFNIRGDDTRTLYDLLGAISSCQISSTLTDDEIERLRSMLNKKKTTLTEDELREKAALNTKWRVERLRLHEPFDFWIDWWTDDAGGGSRFKTWAGKQLVLDIVKSMQEPLSDDSLKSCENGDCLSWSVGEKAIPFYFDSNFGSQSSSLDVGFSLDSLKISLRVRPLIELLTLVALQRFRPLFDKESNVYRFQAWTDYLPPLLAAAAVAGLGPLSRLRFCFSLLYRTKYLKAFLPATQIEGEIS